MKTRPPFHETEHTIYINAFSHYAVHIILTNDLKLSRDKRNKRIGHVCNLTFENTDAFHDGIPGHSYLFFDVDEICTGTIAHECFHVLWEMFGYFGCKFENETTAYHLGYLVDEVVKTIHRRRTNERRGKRTKAVSGRNRGRRRASTNPEVCPITEVRTI